MNTRTIPIQVSAEYVKGAGVPVGAAGSHNDVLLEITFSPLWDGLAKSITWLNARKEDPTITILTTNLLAPGETNVYLVPIPAEPKKYAGDMYLSIKGAAVESGVEVRATMSVSCTFPVLPSDYDGDAEESGDITPTQAEQLQAEIDHIKEDVATQVSQAEDAKDAATQAAAESQAEADRAQGEADRAQAEADRAQGEADRAQAEADRASVPAVQGVYNVVLQDRVTGDRYALIVENCVLKLLGVAQDVEATSLTLIDHGSGTAHNIIIENGVLTLEEV